jgi:hypothetical protein
VATSSTSTKPKAARTPSVPSQPTARRTGRKTGNPQTDRAQDAGKTQPATEFGQWAKDIDAAKVSAAPAAEAPQEPAVEEPAKITARQRKALLAQALITAGANMIDGWDELGEEITHGIDREAARVEFSLWLKYLPRNGGWDSRLGPDPAAK